MSLPLRALVLVGLTAVALVIAAATGLADHRIDPEPGRLATVARAPDRAAAVEPTVVTRGVVTGRLAEHRRHKTVDQVAEVVDGWLDGGFTSVAYPRTRFAGAYDGFTSAARPAARRDGDLLTNRVLGARIEAVTVRRRTVRVDLLATKGRPRAATAHVLLRFDTASPDRRVTVRGRVLLLPTPRGWRIFGYDVTQGRKAA